MFIKQDALDNAVLFKLFVHAQKSDDRLKKAEIAELFDVSVSAKRVELALDSLSSGDQVSRSPSASFSIAVSGYRRVEQQLAQANSFFRMYADGGDDWLEKQTIDLGGVPAADRIVTRSHNEIRFEEVAKELAIIEGQLDSNNEVGSKLGDEKELIKGEVEAAVRLTSSQSFRLARLVSLLMPALRYLTDKFGGAAIGEAAKRLVQLLLEMV